MSYPKIFSNCESLDLSKNYSIPWIYRLIEKEEINDIKDQKDIYDHYASIAYFFSVVGIKGYHYSVIFDVLIIVICYIYKINYSFEILQKSHKI